MLQAILGRIRAPRYAQITLSTEGERVTLHFTATHLDGRQVTYSRTYDGELIKAALVTDLLTWLKATARTFWGDEAGGL